MRAQTGRKVEVWWSKSREEPWRAQAASTRQSRSNPNFRGNRVDTIFRAGLAALLFFLAGLSLEKALRLAGFSRDASKELSRASSSRRGRRNATDQSDPAKF